MYDCKFVCALLVEPGIVGAALTSLAINLGADCVVESDPLTVLAMQQSGALMRHFGNAAQG